MRTEEAGLVSRLVTWTPGAWEAFSAAHGPFLRAESRRQLLRYRGRADAADVEDACQEVFELLLRDGARALRQFRGDASLSTWLGCVVRSVCRRIAERDRSPAALPPDELAAPVPTEEDLPPEGLSAALARLPSRDQRLLRLFFHEGRKYREIARELGVSINSVGPLLARALAAVRRLLPR